MARKKKLLIITAGVWQEPVLLAAKSMGLLVVATDKNPVAPSLRLADFAEIADAQDLEATLKIAEKHCVDGVIAEQTDVAVPAAAYVAERMGLPGIGYDVALAVTDKWHMRETCRQAGLTGPKYRRVETLDDAVGAAEEIGLPVILKPVDSQGSRGVAKIRTAADISPWFKKARCHSRKGSILIEEMMLGPESSVEAFVSDGKIQILGICDKVKCAPPYSYDVRLNYPADFASGIVEEILALNEKVVNALQIPIGLTHAEFIVTEKGARLIEIAARGCGAAVATKLIPAMTGLEPIQERIRQALGTSGGLGTPHFQKCGLLEFLMLPPGKVTKIEGLDQARKIAGVVTMDYNLKIGDTVRVAESGEERPGYLLAVAESRAKVLAIAEKAKRTAKVKLV